LPSRKTRLQDIAKRLGVSAASVSRALADNPRISQTLRKKVQQAAAEMGYVPNTAARALRTGKPDMAALMVPNLAVLRNEGNLDVLQAIDDELGQHGIRLMVASYHQPALVPSTMNKVMADPRLAGLLFLTDYITEPLLEIIKNSTMPTVLANAYPERIWENWEDLYTSGTENMMGAELATRYLIQNGHSKIAAFVCEPGKRDADLREEGYLNAMNNSNLDVDPSYLVRCDFVRGFETGHRAIHRLLTSCEKTNRPTALFCSSDEIAAGALRGITEVGLRVPEDIELIGFGNHPLSVGLTPPLTTITHDGASVGRGAARLFLTLVNGDEPKDKKILQPAELIVRKSTIPQHLRTTTNRVDYPT
jgi:DNA-binding LacI/PurR family transcriptional regulator